MPEKSEPNILPMKIKNSKIQKKNSKKIKMQIGDRWVKERERRELSLKLLYVPQNEILVPKSMQMQIKITPENAR